MPVLIEGAVDLTLVAMLFLLIGLLYAFKYTFEPILRTLHSSLHWVPFVGDLIGSAENALVAGLNTGIATCSRVVADLLHGLAWMAGEVAAGIEALAGETERALRYLRGTALPQVVHGIVNPVAQLLDNLQAAYDGFHAHVLRQLEVVKAALNEAVDTLHGEIVSAEAKAEHAATAGLRALHTTLSHEIAATAAGLEHRLDNLVDTVRGDLAAEIRAAQSTIEHELKSAVSDLNHAIAGEADRAKQALAAAVTSIDAHVAAVESTLERELAAVEARAAKEATAAAAQGVEAARQVSSTLNATIASTRATLEQEIASVARQAATDAQAAARQASTLVGAAAETLQRQIDSAATTVGKQIAAVAAAAAAQALAATETAVRGIGALAGQLEGQLGALTTGTIAGLAAGLAAARSELSMIEAESGLDNPECRTKVRGICSTSPAAWLHFLEGLAVAGALLDFRQLVELGGDAVRTVEPIARDYVSP